MSDNTKENHSRALLVLTSLFFLWGFITSLNDILIPYLKAAFELTHFQANLVQFAFFGAYFVGSVVYFLLSITIGDPIGRIGYKNGILLGLCVAAGGCSLFYPAAVYNAYGVFLSALFCLGLGLTILQIAANPYVALLGSADTASSRLNLSQAFNSLGTTIAPVLGGYFIFQFFGSEVGSDSVKVPYLLLSGCFLLLALLISKAKLPKFVSDEDQKGKIGALHYPHLTLGMGAIFCYVGAEVAIGSNLVSFMGLPEIAGLGEASASRYLAFYWGGAMIGRFMGAVSLSGLGNGKKYGLMALSAGLAFAIIYVITNIPIGDLLLFILFMLLNYLAFFLGRSLPGRTMGIFAIASICLLIAGVMGSGITALWAVIAIGLFNSIMWSNIFTLAIDGLEEDTSQGSSLLVMMILGGALISPLQGYMADRIGLQLSFLVPAICYVYLVFYGFRGYNWNRS